VAVPLFVASRLGRRLRLPLAAATAALSGVLVLGVLPGSAAANPSDRVRAHARAVAAQIDALQPQVDEALAQYRATLGGLARAVTRSVSDDRAAQSAAQAAQQARMEQGARIRALYMDGGELSIVDAMLSAGSTADMTAQWDLTESIVGWGQLQHQTLQQVSHTAQGQARSSQVAASRVIVTVGDVQDRYQTLAALLDQQQNLLDQLDTRAKHLVRAERSALAAEHAAAAAAAAQAAASPSVMGIPKDYLALYRSAATTCPGLGWPVLAAIGQVESGHGHNMGPSSAGAEGPMQFMPSTFAGYAVDGNGDGATNIWDPADSIYTAAAYLCANGGGSGPKGLYNAIWHYNHADWYVLMVVNLADSIAKRFGVPAPQAAKG